MNAAKNLAHDINVVIALANPTRLKILLALFNSEVLKIGPEFEKGKK